MEFQDRNCLLVPTEISTDVVGRFYEFFFGGKDPHVYTGVSLYQLVEVNLNNHNAVCR